VHIKERAVPENFSGILEDDVTRRMHLLLSLIDITGGKDVIIKIIARPANHDGEQVSPNTQTVFNIISRKQIAFLMRHYQTWL
jgi:hypothetical protein